MSPEQLLGELDDDRERTLICDLEAGVGTVLRMEAGQADHVLVVCEPTAKAIEVARRTIEIAAPLARVTVVANRVRDDEDVEHMRSALGDQAYAVVPHDPAVARADRDGLAPIDAAPDAPGVRAIAALAERLAA